MKLNEYINHDGLGLAELIRQGEVTEAEVLDCAHMAIDLINPAINAVIETYPQPLSGDTTAAAPFQGVPFILKDIALHAKDQLIEFGSRLAQGVRFPHDTDLMRQFRKAGLRSIARASAPEFGYCATTEPLLHGPTRNPWDLERMPGGSSGATAACVAAGIVPLAHANDGGGSIRLPAACCGLVGLKPSRGRIPAGPDVAEALSGLAVEFAVTRTVRDSAALLDAVHGHGVGDPYIIAPPAQPYVKALNARQRKLRIAYTTESWAGAEVDAEMKSAAEKSAELCRKLGHDVNEAMPQFDWQMFFDAMVVYWTANTTANVNFFANLTGRKIDRSTLEATTLACYEHGKTLSAGQLLQAFAVGNQICRAVGTFFEDYDVLITPTIASPALPLGTLNADDESLDAIGWSKKLFDFTPFTPLFNLTGQPAISLPLHMSRSSLPLGTQFVGHFGDEATLLQLAQNLELAQPWPKIAPLMSSLLD